jgi:hypothetical protein
MNANTSIPKITRSPRSRIRRDAGLESSVTLIPPSSTVGDRLSSCQGSIRVIPENDRDQPRLCIGAGLAAVAWRRWPGGDDDWSARAALA